MILKKPTNETARVIPLFKSNDSVFENMLVVNNSDGKHFLPYHEIIRLEASSNYTHIVTLTKRILVSRTLKSLQAILPDQDFIRIHARHLIHMEHLRLDSRNQVVMSNGDAVPVSRNMRNNLTYK